MKKISSQVLSSTQRSNSKRAKDETIANEANVERAEKKIIDQLD